MIRAGLAQIEITAAVGTPLTGYIARDGNAVGMHDPLMAKALVLADGANQAAIVTCDLLGLHRRDVQRFRQAIQAATGIPADAVMIASSHTHAGPATLLLLECGEVDHGYLALLGEKLVAVSVAAQAQLRPARFGVGHGRVTEGVHNRRKPGDVTDPDLGILRVTDEHGQTMGVVLNYACHPTCLTGENRLFSAEYCGYATDEIQRATGATALFITGAIGDVGPVARGWPVLEQLGERVAQEALRLLPTIATEEWNNVRVATRTLDLPLQPLPTVGELEAELARWRPGVPAAASTQVPPHPKVPVAMRQWAEQTLAQVRSGAGGGPVQSEVQAIRLGDLVLVSAPGELFVELGLAVKQGAGAPHVFIGGFGNDNIGYIPTRRAYPFGGYEVSEAYKYYGYPAALAPEAGEQYVQEAVELCRSVA
ncbi:MAG TPA: neutral/alkaline non-lysosomal ceramidase N-terminal domain-containing protein [Caldilineaceae bacterium]|nr:neutral/alkaline non-lysosomal ceramidase N-terminal domain-containing protein [Caldilineaceae bacterium]